MSKQDCHEVERAGVQQAQDAAVGLYQIAALMIGDEEQAVSLVEETLDGVESDPCADRRIADKEVRPRLVEAALGRLAARYPQAFSAPQAAEQTGTCIDTDDLSSAGVNPAQLSALLQDAGRNKLREWLDKLSPELRAIFVLRAVVGQNGEETAKSMRCTGAAGAGNWEKENVAIAYRQALCSLATSLVSSNPMSAPV
jgi:hypothetical protein